MDNQQGSRQLTEDAVAGLIVGEGSFCIIKINGKRPEYRPTFAIGMGDEETMKLLTEAFTRWGLAYYYYSHKTKSGKPSYRLQVNGYKRTARVLEKFLPFLFGSKLDAAEAMKRFIDSRLQEQGRGRYAPFTELQLSHYHELKRLNKAD